MDVTTFISLATSCVYIAEKSGQTAKKIALNKSLSKSKWRSILGKARLGQFNSLDDLQLIVYYLKEEPLTGEIGKAKYCLPITVVIPSRGEKGTDAPEIRYRLSKKPFKVPEEIACYWEPITKSNWIGKEYSNGTVVSLRGIESIDDIYKLTLCPAKYFDSLGTNFSMDHKPQSRSTCLRDDRHGRQKKFAEFSASTLVNHLGIGCLIETEDGFLVASHRAKKRVATWPNSWSISINASIKFDDICKNHQSDQDEEGTLESLTKCLFREGYDELRLYPEDLIFLGLYREYQRGGKPDFYFYGRTKHSFSTLKKTWEESIKPDEVLNIHALEFNSRDLGKGEKSCLAFYDRILTALDKMNGKANLTLITAFFLAAEYFLNHQKN